jgi:peptide/nickel transport system substrate-binding protein
LRNTIVAGSIALLGAFAGTVGRPTPAWSQEATFVMSSNEVGAPTYDPIKAAMLNVATSLIFDRLVVQDADQSFHPHLAESWSQMPDGMEWTFKLRKGVKFHDGEPFDARTIAWWISRFAGTDNEYMVGAIDKVEVVDDHTVKFHMKHPEPAVQFLQLLHGYSGAQGL